MKQIQLWILKELQDRVDFNKKKNVEFCDEKWKKFPKNYRQIILIELK